MYATIRKLETCKLGYKSTVMTFPLAVVNFVQSITKALIQNTPGLRKVSCKANQVVFTDIPFKT